MGRGKYSGGEADFLPRPRSGKRPASIHAQPGTGQLDAAQSFSREVCFAASAEKP